MRSVEDQKVIASPEYFVQVRLQPSKLYSTLCVDAISRRESNRTLETTRAEFRAEVESSFVAQFGAEQWERIAVSLTKPPSWTCIRSTAPGNQSRESLIQELQDATGHRFQISPLASLEDCIRLDFLKTPCPFNPLPEARVIVDTGCGEAVLRGADVFAPGIKGSTAGLFPQVLVTVWVDLDNSVKRGDKDVQRQARRLLYIGVGITVQSRPEFLAEDRKGVAVKMLHRPTGDSPALNAISDGKIFLQNVPSALVCHALGATRGELVLDMCASPGGKTSHLAQRMQDEGILVACDRTVSKVLPVKQCCDKFAAQRQLQQQHDKSGKERFLYCCRTDSSKANSSTASKQDWSCADFAQRKQALVDLLNRQEEEENGILLLRAGTLPLGVFDRILLDGPCSSLGLRPRFSHIACTNKALHEMAVVQKRMLFNAVMLVKVGGFISYSTCTFNPGENEQVVRWALDLFQEEIRLVPVLPRIGQPGLRSILSAEEAELVQCFDPSDMSVDSIGFFVAKFERLRPATQERKIWVE